MINCLLLSKSERGPLVTGLRDSSPTSTFLCLFPLAGCKTRVPAPLVLSLQRGRRGNLITAGPQPHFLPPRRTASPSAGVGGSQQSSPGFLAEMGQHEIRLLSVCPPRGREEVWVLERQSHRRTHVAGGSCPPTPERNLPGGQFVPLFLIMPPHLLCLVNSYLSFKTHLQCRSFFKALLSFCLPQLTCHFMYTCLEEL